jgi:uncharacterized membrane protein YdbT with pleckstrin-like domain
VKESQYPIASIVFGLLISLTGIGFIVGLPMIVGGVLTLFFDTSRNKWFITNERLICEKGWFNKQTRTTTYDQITDLEVKTRWGKVLGNKVGGIKINTAGSHGHEFVLSNIKNPNEVADLIREQQTDYNQNKAREGVQPATDKLHEQSYLDELERLAQLKERGIISEEEFNNKKEEVLKQS